MPSESFYKKIYYLSPFVKIVDGLKSFSLMNLRRGEIVLINKSAAEILNEFSAGVSLETIIPKYEVPQKKVDEFYSFFEKCVSSEILIPTCDTTSQVKNNNPIRHITTNSLSVVLELLTKCNLYCQHCYNDSHINRKDTLSIEKIKSLFEEFKSNNINLKTLTLTGGEPLLYLDLLGLINLTMDYGFPIVRINTNGTVFPEALLNAIGKDVSKKMRFQVSLLGACKETHDVMTRSRDSFNLVTENIQKYKSKGFEVGISFIKTRYSENEVDEAIKYGEKLGVEVIIGDIFPIGRAVKNYPQLDISSEKPEINIGCNEQFYAGQDYGKISDEKIASILESFPPELPCGKNTIAILSNGDVIPCMLLQGLVVGNINRQLLNQILTSKEMLSFQKRASIENRYLCSKCELRHACSNKCPAVSLFFGGNIASKSPFCTYY